MDDWPCMKAERDLTDATDKVVRAHEKVTQLRAQEPVGRGRQMQRWQRELAKAIRQEADATSEHQKAAQDFEECKEHNPRPNT